MSFKAKTNLSIYFILVDSDLKDGLAKEITIKKGSKSIVQPLNYCGLPLWCIRCHIYGHLVEKCDLLFERNSGLGRIVIPGSPKNLFKEVLNQSVEGTIK